MALSKLEWVAHVSVFVIIVSLALIGFRLTGYAIDTGTVNISIISAAAVNFTVDNVDWGYGAVDNGQTSATLNTEGTVSNGNWSAINEGFRLENIGNVNVTLNISSDQDADAFIGGTSPAFQYKIENNESGSCVTNGASSYTALSGSSQPGCGTFEFLDARDYINVEIQLTVPYDASGIKGAVITANATAQ